MSETSNACLYLCDVTHLAYSSEAIARVLGCCVSPFSAEWKPLLQAAVLLLLTGRVAATFLNFTDVILPHFRFLAFSNCFKCLGKQRVEVRHFSAR